MVARRKRFVVCVKSAGYQASLESRKIYEVLPDQRAWKSRHLRVVDESGQSYLYPESLFMPIALSRALRTAVMAAV
jgi:hypothetical protein